MSLSSQVNDLATRVGTEFKSVRTSIEKGTRYDVTNFRTADYTLALADVNSHVLSNSVSALTFTIPADATVNFPIGTRIRITRWGTGGLTLAAASGAVIAGVANAFRQQYASVEITKVAANVWQISEGLPAGTTTTQGILNLATNAEVVTGTDTAKAVTAAGVKGAAVYKAGDTMTGNLTLPDMTSARVGVLTNKHYASDPSALGLNPFGVLWHDILAFGTHIPFGTYETSPDGTTWTAGTLDQELFSMRENRNSTFATVGQWARITWNSANFSFSNIRWLVLGHAYGGAGDPLKTVTIESSVDGTAWTTRYTGSYSTQAAPVWHHITDVGGNPYVRLTIRHMGTLADGTTPTTATVRLASVRLLSHRWGDQGGGRELELPYTWTADRTVSFVRAKTAFTPVDINDVVRKDYADALGVAADTASTIVRRDASAGAGFATVSITTGPTQVYHATRKDYVDGKTWPVTALTATGTRDGTTFLRGDNTWATPAGATPNTLTIGTVTTLAAGASATASITGTAPNQTLNLGIPQGAAGTGGGGDVTLAGAQTFSGAKTFPVGTLLMTNGTLTAEPYSDVNAPESFMMTEIAAAPATPPAGKNVLYTLDGLTIRIKNDSGTEYAAAPILAPTATKTAPYTMVVGEMAVMNVSGGATTLTLPAAPSNLDRIGFRSLNATPAAPLTVTRGGTATIGESGATSITEPLGGVTRTYQFDSANNRWLPVSDVKPLSTLDARYLNGTVALTDGATIATNAALGRTFRVTVAGDRTFSAPTNAVDGAKIMYEITASGASRTVTFATGAAGAFAYGTDFTSIPAIASGTTTFVGAQYSSRSSRWHILAVGSGHV